MPAPTSPASATGPRAARAAGGAGLALAELFPILRSFGRYTVSVAQTIVARALLGSQRAMPCCCCPLHGAIGAAEEYDLQLLTRRLHEWRMAHGSEAHWNVLIGNSVLAADVSIVDFVRAV